MIPNHMKSRARQVLLLSFGIVLTGALFSLIWVLTYMPK
jgi:hypothetical protein